MNSYDSPLMDTPKISTLVVDDSADLAEMLAILISGEPDMACVGTLGNADELLQSVEKRQPNVVLLDLTMPGRTIRTSALS
jgi:chemotaxis response regulator CheB